ncbi:hypothetical protein VTK56DRAFT_6244 [Thermocarpiscus australiensis]
MSDSNELLDAFKAAAFSVTKLYKTSAAAQAKSRADGYQDCLEDLLSWMDREAIGLRNGEGQRIRDWIVERLEGRNPTSPALESSEDEADKAEPPVSSPEMQRAIPVTTQRSSDRSEDQMRDSVPPVLATAAPAVEEVDIVVPSQDTFTFQSSLPYPQDEAMRLANLNLSDSQTISPSNRSALRNGRSRNTRTGGPRASLGRGAGQKRKVNLAEIFDLGSLDYGNGKDMFGSGSKRSRHV